MLVEARDITVRVGDLTPVSVVPLALPRGVLPGLIAPNGAGRTTLLRGHAAPTGFILCLPPPDLPRTPDFETLDRPHPVPVPVPDPVPDLAPLP